MRVDPELAALAAIAVNLGIVPVTKLPSGEASAPVSRRTALPAYALPVRDSVVYDHLGREHVRNSEGEWLS